MDHGDFGWLEQALGQPVVTAAPAEWGVRHRAELMILADGTRVVTQRYRRRAEAERRARVLRALREPAAAKGIAVPGIRAVDLDADPPWIAFEALPGVPATADAASGPGGPGFPLFARDMGALLADFAELSCPDLELDDVWARPRYLAARADAWAECLVAALTPAQNAALEALLAELPALFDGRPAVLAHGDFAPENVLVAGGVITGLLDFDSARLADPLFDAAWWAWSVSLTGADVLASAWPEFLAGLGVDPAEPALAQRIRALQITRMLEMLADADLPPDMWRTVHDRLTDALGV
ncbi:phosphotransferase family protein [Nocardia terpenica]|uniref:Aminoglycoside phosphotransferase domain-containing protein n=1 Tax=Nocardia terpenica TaxID=455432 RepID=A0A164KFX8_9NOCA|nr:aminoglycoside phosphotransferase family protein [Nocardia terpenica]KZM71355.1 hypothetical protein AWN90_00835 [Nocardia terpenica]NQE90502.1 aminoglycoside phosphotransferase family protein [Nocardia terpenica]